MKNSSLKTYVFWIAVSEAVGAVSGYLTREGTKNYQTYAQKPPLSPPGIVFPVVWTILFALMGIGIARIVLSRPSAARSCSITLYWAQLFFNFFWSILFFNIANYGVALVWLIALWGLILWMIFAFYKVDPPAAYLQIPYLLWVTFAAYLNYGAWMLNK